MRVLIDTNIALTYVSGREDPGTVNLFCSICFPDNSFMTLVPGSYVPFYNPYIFVRVQLPATDIILCRLCAGVFLSF